MRRREFLGVLGGAAAWPSRRGAQQSKKKKKKKKKKGGGAPPPPLQHIGWTDGRNLRDRIAVCGRQRRGESRSEIAAEFVALAPDVIISSGDFGHNGGDEARDAHRSRWYLSAVNEPVAQGFVDSLARPGGNITGFTHVNRLGRETP